MDIRKSINYNYGYPLITATHRHYRISSVAVYTAKSALCKPFGDKFLKDSCTANIVQAQLQFITAYSKIIILHGASHVKRFVGLDWNSRSFKRILTVPRTANQVTTFHV